VNPNKSNIIKSAWFLLLLFATMAVIIRYSSNILVSIGHFIVQDETPMAADAIVVLYTGTEYYPRLLQAAKLYRKGLAGKVVINGDRKSETLLRLESNGFQPCCAWYDNYVQILNLYGVPRTDIITIAAENVYDTITEAATLGPELIKRELNTVLITTSRYHTRRAGHIWKQMYDGQLTICSVGAEDDPFDPSSWWRDGRQIRWVLAEYGAWIYYGWKRLKPV
jgi:uncharacterized SAM-binding protein YcdF (DUF218 family)